MTIGIKHQTFDEIKDQSVKFDLELRELKEREKEKIPNWYPYYSLTGFNHLDLLFSGQYRDFLSDLPGKEIADIGCADGDMSFFMESLGFDVDAIDYKPTNFNKMNGVYHLKDKLQSNINIHSVDLDSQFSMPKNTYDLILFMGILYHLKNPFYILEKLAHSSRYLILSTRVARHTTDQKTDLNQYPLAYLVDASEMFNNDASNYWIFSEGGLKRILYRTHWDIVNYITVGDQETSDPVSQNNDERAFVLVKSRAI